MVMFKKKKTVVTIVNDEKIYFAELDHRVAKLISQALPLDRFLSDKDGCPIPKAIGHTDNNVLLIPDYWLGSFSFPFQTKKKSLVEAYLERRLGTDRSFATASKRFFDYTDYMTDQGGMGFYAYYLQESTFIQLYEQLVKCGVVPSFITAPGLLWERKLRSLVPDFADGGKLLVCLGGKECFLYLFSTGHYLFSRNIPFPDSEIESSDRLKTITYEINQSLYSFAQQTKSEMREAYLWSSTPSQGYAAELTEMLDREVLDLSAQNRDSQTKALNAEYLGPASLFTAKDLSPSTRFLNLVDKQVKTNLEWRPIQFQGIVVGICVLLLLIGQNAFVWKWSSPRDGAITRRGTLTKTRDRETLNQYYNALEILAQERNRPRAGEALVKVAQSLPENMRLTNMIVEMEQIPSIYLEGISKASGPDQLKDSLSSLLTGLKSYFQESRSLLLKDIDFEADNRGENFGLTTYKFKLRFDL